MGRRKSAGFSGENEEELQDMDQSNAKKRLKAQIAQCKGSLTKAENFIREHQDGSLDQTVITTRLNQVKMVLDSFNEYSLQLHLLEDQCSEEDFLEDNLEDRALTIISNLQKLLTSQQATGSHNSSYQSAESSSHPNLKLPHIDIPVFDGKDVTRYQPFIELYSAVIDKNLTLESTQKLFYLRKFLKGEALSLIEGLPLTGQSYPKALQLLNTRYDNKFLVITTHIQALLDFQPMVKGTASSLRELVAHARQHLAALDTLGQATEQWDMIILTIMLRKVDQFSCRAYHSERDNKELPKLDEFFTFMERRASSFEESQRSEGKTSTNFLKNKVNNLANSQQVSIPLCKFCSNEGHKIFNCPQFHALDADKRVDFVKDNALCKVCLMKHNNKCRFHFKCQSCNSKEHNSLLHIEGNTCGLASLHSNAKENSMVLLPTVKVKFLTANGRYIVAKGLVDSGSQTSFVTTQLMKKLNQKTMNHNIKISAIGNQEQTINKAVQLKLTSLHNNFSCVELFSVIDKITSLLPQTKFNLDNVSLPESIELADDEYNVPSEIDFLLSANVFFKIMLPNKITLNKGNLTLLNTQFGYILSGNILLKSFNQHQKTVLHAAVQDNDDNHLLQKFWEAEIVPEIKREVISKQDPCEAEFKRSVQLTERKFEVTFPLKYPVNQLNLGDTLPVALARLNMLQRRFNKDQSLYLKYKAFIDEYLAMGHAKILPLNISNIPRDTYYFLCHHPVIREDRKTTKLRVVFDGNTKSDRLHNSLNECLETGHNVQSEIFDILILFRTYKYVLTTDVRHMYRCILMDESQRHLQNILWKDDNDKLVCLQLQTITYGLRSSPFLATRCLKELADRYSANPSYRLAAEVIYNNTYVDDALFGANTVDEAIQVRDQLIKLLSLASFDLHKWAANDISLLEGIPKSKQYLDDQNSADEQVTSLKVLGLRYDVSSDKFQLQCPKRNISQWTKRSLVSVIGSFFDPLGLLGPVVVKAKEFLQKTWLEHLKWDSPIPEELLKEWLLFYNKVLSMATINIDRNLNIAKAICMQLYGFCDASTVAYGCCIYIRVMHDEGVTCKLLCAKSRIAPIKGKLTIPRLELNSAVLLSKLYSRVKSTLIKLNISNGFLFSDSQIVLCWLRSEKSLPTYINNRVDAIKELTQDCQWNHIAGSDNPADCLSRGCDPQDLVNNVSWWYGPQQLLSPCHVPLASPGVCNHNQCLNEEECNDERPVCLSSLQIPEFFTKFSSITGLCRVVTWMLRFINNCKIHDKLQRQKDCLTASEVRYGRLKVIFNIQQVEFAEELSCIQNRKIIKTHLKGLHPFIDNDGILRVGGRLENACIPFSQKCPIILPQKCYITELIVRNEHLALMHSGLKLTLASLMQSYYIVSATKVVKKIIHKCVKCFRLRAQNAQQLMGALPSERVRQDHVFNKVGIDYCGPFDVKQSSIRRSYVSKGYVCVFVCFVTKCIHLELVSDLTTEAFLAALKRFCGRRGLPMAIYCDNASTFKGANNELRRLYDLHNSQDHKNNVLDYCSCKGIEFKFIPAYSPTFGGLWEASIKSFKYHFKRVIDKIALTYEQFNTIIIQIEAILNSRPLTPLTEDISDFSYLSPGHFLVNRPLNAPPEGDVASSNINIAQCWKKTKIIQQQFWKLWHKSYIYTLISRPKWQNVVSNVKIGALALMIDENVPPLHWPLARITKLIKGKDNKVRVVELKTSKGVHTRAINKIAVLPLDS